ncbi:hypothetical protein [Venatoribacter cucullus]|uniref:hypothetical protein n=1 Tax=Venatoribacter cucullus TaxID=2661630 RepID=UPI001935DEF9|nr:hypothetical protein [Venatoribacter cucullus]QQD21678.1 hypothetical protein GJQ54_07805 [Oceanospirillaceae bacterium ASx5O]UZK03458.1 hypothetical protein GAY96_05895 [Venatoribacter cucullus]
MQDIDTTSTQSLIDRYYQEEKALREKEMTLAALTVRLDANDLAMLNVIARRFRKTRDEIAQEVLSNALVDLFARIDAGERKLLARDADDAARAIADEIAEENGVRNVEIKTGVWANHDRQITKLERKKARLSASDTSTGNTAEQDAEPSADISNDMEAGAQADTVTDNADTQENLVSTDSSPAISAGNEEENTTSAPAPALSMFAG